MSVDYVSYVAWVRAAAALRIVEEPAAYEAPIEAEDGTVVFRPGIDRPFRPKAIARAVGRVPPSPEDTRVSAAETSMLGDPTLESSGVAVMSSNFPLLPLIDRVVAIPNGIRFMEGFAYARLRPKRRARLAAQWSPLIEHLGGMKKVALRLVPYIDRGGDAEAEAREILTAITKGLREAETRNRDLLLLGVDLSK